MTPEMTSYTCQKHNVYTEYSLPRPKFHSQTVSLYDHQFSRYKVVENRKCIELSQNDIRHLTVKRALYTLNTHPRGTNFHQPFAKYKPAENRKCTE